MFKVITYARDKNLRTPNLMEQDIKKLILGDCEITDAGCQVIADIVKAKDTIKELDLPKNTKSSKKYKIAIDESAVTVEKAKTTINNMVMSYHNEVTHPDEAHEECFVQLPCLGDEAHPERLQGQDVHSSGISQPERLTLLAEEDCTVPSVMKLIEKLTDEEVEEMIPVIDVDDTQCSEQIVDVPVPQIAERIVEVVTAFHGSESQSESLHRSSNMSGHTE